MAPLTETAIKLASSGKIGALNLLFKRHPYSLSPSILEILSAIPETVPVQSYGQLLPGRSPPSVTNLKDGDSVECEEVTAFVNKLPPGSKGFDVKTENILKHSVGFVWPSVTELSYWYKKRAMDIDKMSGQLDNCLSLVDCGFRKGIVELQEFLEDISYLNRLIYSDRCDVDLTMTLTTWEQLPDYEKFRMMLKGVKAEAAVERLREIAIPFMQHSLARYKQDSFVVRWMKEESADNKLDICLAVTENACRDSPVDGLFASDSETIECALNCIYLCTLTDQWNLMASILSKLPRRTTRDKSCRDFTPRYNSTQGFGTPRFSYLRNQLSISETQSDALGLNEENSSPQHFQGSDELVDSSVDNLEKRIKVTEGHVEVGRMLQFYQVPKPISFFLDSQSDEKNVKQLLRLILSKFGRRQPGRSDNEWANMWRDMQYLQDKAFHFLDTEYMLTEFCRGLLKAGKFSLARNYLKGTSAIALATEKAENLVIQAAREYFYSASSLSCTEIWKVKECLSLLPDSKNVQAELDMVDALTVRLPNLGVNLLPVEYRQIRNPMEIINMVISNQRGAYLDVEEIIEIAKLLGLRSEVDITSVEESVAREAAVAGDMQLAFDLCLVLAKKGHGPIWDLCAAIARGPLLDGMDTGSRKQLLGFALSHCDEESIGDLLNAWKEVDMRSRNEQLMTSTGTCPSNFSTDSSSVISLPVHSIQDIFELRESSDEDGNDYDIQFERIKEMLSRVGKDCSGENGMGWDSLLRENKKALTFSSLELPWLLKLSQTDEYGKGIPSAKDPLRKHRIPIRMQALVCVFGWLARNDVAASDDLVASLAKSVMEPPVTEEGNVLGCSFLLNLTDAFRGVEIIQEQLKKRKAYQEIYSIMNVGMAYSSLHNSHKECSTPEERRNMLLHKFHEKHAPFKSDDIDQIDEVQSTFWREWKKKLEEQRQLADQARALEQVLPGIETARFLAGDVEYIKNVVFSFIDSVKVEKKHILSEAVKLADSYGVNRIEVLLRFFGCSLVSDHWGNDDILAEIADYRENIVASPKGVIDTIRTVVYPEIDGHNKQRLSYMYSILSACYLQLSAEEPELTIDQDQEHKHILEPFQYFKVLEQECQRVSFISKLNFKHIAGLNGVDFEHFNEEICNSIHESTVEALSDTVQTLVGMYSSSEAEGLISWQSVFKLHALGLLASLQSGIEARCNTVDPDEFRALIGEIVLNYDVCKKYIRLLSDADKYDITEKYRRLCIPPCSIPGNAAHESTWKNCLILQLNFWIKLAVDVSDEATQEKLASVDIESLLRCLKVFQSLVMEGEISANQGWSTINNYTEVKLASGSQTDISCLFKAMIFSGCPYQKIAQVYHEAELDPTHLRSGSESKYLLDMYISLTNTVLMEVSSGSDEHEKLHALLSSLSLSEGSHSNGLKTIRSEVWGKLSALSDDMRLESQIRVHALELMQFLTGRNIIRSHPVKKLFSEFEPWEAWDESCTLDSSLPKAQEDASSSSITSTLVALKSTRLIASISPNFKVSVEDLVSVDSALSCFTPICRAAATKSDLNALQAVLDEWEELFPASKEKEVAGESQEDAVNNWSSDEWDEGWENFAEETVSNVEGKDGAAPVHPLHACWMEVISRLVEIHEPGLALEVLDRSLSGPNGVLLDENEARFLLQLLGRVDCFHVLKVLLLLPYDAPRLQCLQLVEAELADDGGFSRHIDDYELLALVLSSGALRVVSGDPAFGKVLSYVCYLTGHLARVCQVGLLRLRRDGTTVLFGALLLPATVSELVEAGQHFLAAFIVSRWMHTPESLGLLEVTEVILRRYLEGQVLLQAQAQGGGGGGGTLEVAVNSFGSLGNTVSRLKVKLGSMLQSALSAISTSVDR